MANALEHGKLQNSTFRQAISRSPQKVGRKVRESGPQNGRNIQVKVFFVELPRFRHFFFLEGGGAVFRFGETKKKTPGPSVVPPFSEGFLFDSIELFRGVKKQNQNISDVKVKSDTVDGSEIGRKPTWHV